MAESYECCDFIKKVGINMLFYRKVKGLTQAELAKRSGLATVSYAGIEHCKIISTLKTFFNIANTISYQIKKGGEAMSKILSPQNREIVKKLCLENKLTIPSNETFPFHSQKNPAAGRSF